MSKVAARSGGEPKGGSQKAAVGSLPLLGKKPTARGRFGTTRGPLPDRKWHPDSAVSSPPLFLLPAARSHFLVAGRRPGGRPAGQRMAGEDCPIRPRPDVVGPQMGQRPRPADLVGPQMGQRPRPADLIGPPMGQRPPSARSRWPPNRSTTSAARPSAGPSTGVFLLRQGLVDPFRGQRPRPAAVLAPFRGQRPRATAVLVPFRGQQEPNQTLGTGPFVWPFCLVSECRAATPGALGPPRPRPHKVGESPYTQSRNRRMCIKPFSHFRQKGQKWEPLHQGCLPLSLSRPGRRRKRGEPAEGGGPSAEGRAGQRTVGENHPAPRHSRRGAPNPTCRAPNPTKPRAASAKRERPRPPRPPPAGRGAGRSHAGRGRGHARMRVPHEPNVT